MTDIAQLTDMMRLTWLLDSFGVPYQTGPAQHLSAPKGSQGVLLEAGLMVDIEHIIRGYSGFVSEYVFDATGTFLYVMIAE